MGSTMGEQEFWNGKERFFSDIINRVNDLLSDAYLLITNRNSHVTMIPEKTAAFFEMQAGYVKDFYQAGIFTGNGETPSGTETFG